MSAAAAGRVAGAACVAGAVAGCVAGPSAGSTSAGSNTAADFDPLISLCWSCLASSSSSTWFFDFDPDIIVRGGGSAGASVVTEVSADALGCFSSDPEAIRPDLLLDMMRGPDSCMTYHAINTPALMTANTRRMVCPVRTIQSLNRVGGKSTEFHRVRAAT